MGEDIIFRNSMFGFNKEDVIKYIEELKKENSQRLEDMQNTVKDVKKQDIGITENNESIFLINEYKDQITELKSEIEYKKLKISELEDRCEKFHKIEDQLGSMILDAYICSENIIYDAKARAEQLAQDTSESIDQTVIDINEYSKYIDNLSNEFSEIVSSMTRNIKSVSESLINASKALKEENTEQENDDFDYPDINDYINGLFNENTDEDNDDFDSSILFEYQPEKCKEKDENEENN